MNKKRILMAVLALFVLNVLNINMGSIVSANPTSPYIAAVPSKDTVMIDMNHTVSIYTDYAGDDVWGWNVRLTFDPTVLEVVKVVNGDLIVNSTTDFSAVFISKINNTIGEVSAGAFFYYVYPPPTTTSGPGILTKITFRGIGTVYSDATLEKETKLQGYDPWGSGVYDIIEAVTQPKQIGHGIVMVSQIIGDITGAENPSGSGIYPPDGVVDGRDLIYLGANFGTNDPVADFTGPENPPGSGKYPPDGTVDGRDLILLGANFGSHI